MPRVALSYDNNAIADVLDEIADLLDLKGENLFRGVTYRAAARSIRELREPLRAYMEQKRLTEIARVGPGVAEVITQLLTAGSAKRHEELKAAVPPGLLTLLRVPGIGPATVRSIHQHLGITTLEELEQAAESGRLRTLPKIQARTEENIKKAIASLRQRTGRALIDDARAAADEMVSYLRERCALERISVAGSLRRWRETIGDVDIVVAAREAGPIMDAFTGAPAVERILAKGDTKSSVVAARGLQLDLRVVPEASYGAALLYFTGSKEHNVALRGLALRKKLLLNEYGLYRAGEEKAGVPIASRTEEEVYAALGMDWIPPELREDRGEIAAAIEHRLPVLLEPRDIRGDLHAHTSWTDGRDTVADMARAAKARGYEYLSLTDHSPGLGMTRGLDVERIVKRNEEIAAINAELAPFRVLIGTEVDIRANGRLDYPDEVLRYFDVVTASVHSSFDQPRARMTERIVGAMRHPLVDAISHPTGRLLEKRDPYDVDLERVLEVAAETGTRVEINGGPERLDLPDVWVRKAVERGVRLVANSDAHAIEELSYMDYAVAVARRGWAGAGHVENARGLRDLESLRRKRDR